jgi:hypothetical protein
MILVNHDLKAIYIHIPKCGGSNIKNILIKNYNFISAEVNPQIRRPDHVKNFCTNPALDNKNLGITSIRKKGLMRYVIDHTYMNQVCGLDEEKWNTYFKFTFIRDPYKKLVSAFFYLKAAHYSFEDKNYEEDCFFKLSSFFNYTNHIKNIGYFHSIMTQNDHLLNNNNKIDVNYIGNLNTFDSDFCAILNILGITDFKHTVNQPINTILNKSNMYEWEKFHENYTKSVLDSTNKIFADDFSVFQFNKIENFDDFIQFYSTNIPSKTIEPFSQAQCPHCTFMSYNAYAQNAHSFYCK